MHWLLLFVGPELVKKEEDLDLLWIRALVQSIFCLCLLLAISFPLSSSVSVCAMMPGLLGQQQAERVHMVDGSGHT